MKTNKTKKVVKPLYTVDITDCETVDDVALKIALAKHHAGLPMTDRNLLNIVAFVVDLTISIMKTEPAIMFVCDCCEKKKPWYKRFWNWLRGRK